MSIGTGVSAGIGCPQRMGLGIHPCFCVPPENRAGSTVDFRVVETGPTFLRLAWRPGPERPQGYSLIYSVQGEGMVPARVGAAWAPCLCAASGQREVWMRVNAGIHAQSAGCGVHVCADTWMQPVYSTAGGFMCKGQGVCLGVHNGCSTWGPGSRLLSQSGTGLEPHTWQPYPGLRHSRGCPCPGPHPSLFPMLPTPGTDWHP